MKRLFAALLTAALLLAGCAPAGEGLSSAPAETVTGFRWGGEEDTLHQFADHDGSITATGIIPSPPAFPPMGRPPRRCR